MRIALALLALAALPAAAVVCNVADFEVRVGSCDGPAAGFDTNLDRACEKHPKKILVRCQKRCVERDGLACKRCGWREKKRAACTAGGDRMKFKNCSAKEVSFADAAIGTAIARLAVVETKIDLYDASKLSDQEQRRFRRAREKVERVRKWLDRDRKFKCKDAGEGGCGGTTNAVAVPLTGGVMAIKLCPNFFRLSTARAAGVVAHEASHSCCGTSDEEYYSGSKQPNRSDNWPNVADTYDWWVVNGFCVPSDGRKCVRPK
jgi:hypothetical protein